MDKSAECDGFDDCLNQADELECGNVEVKNIFLRFIECS